MVRKAENLVTLLDYSRTVLLRLWQAKDVLQGELRPKSLGDRATRRAQEELVKKYGSEYPKFLETDKVGPSPPPVG